MALPKNLNDRKYWTYFQDNVAYTNDAGTAIPIGTFVGGQYNSSAPTYTDGDPGVFQLTSDGRLKVDTDITLTDIDVEIGAVELKDATSDTRAVIKSDGTNNALVVTMNALPSLVAGSATIGNVTVSSLSALVEGTATIGSVKITDGAETLQIATDGAAVKTKGIMFMGTDGTNSQTLSVTTTGQLHTAYTYLDDADWTTEASYHALVGGIYQSTAQTVTDGDTAPIQVDVNGKIIESNSGSIKTAVEIMDDWDDSNYCNVNINVAGTDIAANTGALNAQTIRTTLATDDPQYGAVGAATDVDGSIHAQLRYIGEAVDELPVPTTLTGGSKTVTASGTAEALGTTLATKSIYIRAKATNTSFVCVGDSNVDEATSQQIILYANDSLTLDIANRLTVFVDADVNGEGVDYVCMG